MDIDKIISNSKTIDSKSFINSPLFNEWKKPEYIKFKEIIYKLVKNIESKDEDNIKKFAESSKIDLILNYMVILDKKIVTGKVNKKNVAAFLIPIFNFVVEVLYMHSIDLLAYLLVLNSEELSKYTCKNMNCIKITAHNIEDLKTEFANSKKLNFCNDFLKENGMNDVERKLLIDNKLLEIRNKFSHFDYQITDDGYLLGDTPNIIEYETIINYIQNTPKISWIIIYTITTSIDVKYAEPIFKELSNVFQKMKTEDPEFEKMIDEYMKERS